MMVWKRLLTLPLCFASLTLFADISEEKAVQRVRDHLVIKDFFSAVQEGKQYLALYPDSKKLHTILLKALCEKGEEVEAFQEMEKLSLLLQANEKDRFFYETLAWGVLNKGETSSLLMIRLYSLLGAAFTHDARAIPILKQELRSSNAYLRSIAIKIAASYGDASLQEEIGRLVKEEKVWYVRLEAIQAAGHLRLIHLKRDLKEIVAHPKTLAEEKVAAIIALVSMCDSVDTKEINSLLQSNRSGLRELGCEIIAHFEHKESIPKLLGLLQDPSPNVRIAALNTLGLLKVSSYEGKPLIEYIDKNIKDPVPAVAITAAWTACVVRDPQGLQLLQKWIEQDDVDYKRMASAALSIVGKEGVALATSELSKQSDPYIKVNLALGLIGQRKEVDKASKELFSVLLHSGGELWMWDQSRNPLFRSIAPSKVRHIEQIPRYPYVIDQQVKLDVLSVLSIVKFPQALEAVKEFLQNQSWGITAAAASMLLEEGDEQSLALVRELLNDPDQKIRVQAALILAMFGGDSSAVKTLQEAYPLVDREMKIYIIEALGHIGDPISVPFLLEILKEPFQVLRVVSASALIQCLYH